MKNQLHIITDQPDTNGDYLFTKNKRVYASLNGTVIDLAKMVYATFNNDGRDNLDINDTNWDIEHIDGDFTNNSITNLKYKIK